VVVGRRRHGGRALVAHGGAAAVAALAPDSLDHARLRAAA
jgi:hypothetical protein